MKKFVMILTMMCLMSTNAFAVDLFGYNEFQSYSKSGYKLNEAFLEAGQDISGLFRPFVSIQHFADNGTSGYNALDNFYRAGISKDVGPVNVSGGFIYNQSLVSGESNDHGFFLRASFIFNTSK